MSRPSRPRARHSVLSDADAQKIRDLSVYGVTQKNIAMRLDLPPSVISRCLKEFKCKTSTATR